MYKHNSCFRLRIESRQLHFALLCLVRFFDVQSDIEDWCQSKAVSVAVANLVVWQRRVLKLYTPFHRWASELCDTPIIFIYMSIFVYIL